MFDAYWISPKGEVLQVGGTKTHIRIVIDNPKKFGETKERIEKDYKKHKESITWEGKAREEIMIRIMKRGWVRIRERHNSWTVQVWKMSPKMNDILWMWANTIKKTVFDKFAPVNIYEIQRLKSKPSSIKFIDLSSGQSVSEDVDYHTKDFKIVENVDDLSDIDYPPEFDDTNLNETLNKYIK